MIMAMYVDVTSMIKQHLKMDFERNFCTWRFWVIVLLIPVLMIICDLEEIKTYFKYQLDYGFFCSLDAIQEILVFDRFKTVMTVMLSAISCFAISDDLSSHYCRMVLCRMDLRQYCLSKILMNAAAVIVATILGFLLFIIVMLPIMPMVNEDIMRVNAFGYMSFLAKSPFPWLAVVLWAVLFAMFIVFLTTFSMWMSVYRPSRYVAIAIPFGLFYILYALTTMPGITAINMWYISSGVDVLNTDSFLFGYGYGILFFGILTALCGWRLYRAMVRRVNNGNI